MNGYVVSKKKNYTSEQNQQTDHMKKKATQTERIIKVFFFRIKRIIITSGSTGPFDSFSRFFYCPAHHRIHTNIK